MTEAKRHRRRREHKPGMEGFRSDLRLGWQQLMLKTSVPHRWFFLFILLVGIVLRVVRINEPVTYDEALTYVDYSSRSFAFLFGNYMSAANQVLHSALVRLSTGIFGIHLWSLRLPALVAGILVLPLFYAFVRAVFNRHIALIALSLAAVSGPLVEYSALARGYSLEWLLMIAALLAARHFVKRENHVSLVLMALFCALGVWAVPSMVHCAVMIYAWSLFLISSRYKSTMRRRSAKLFWSVLLFIALTLLFYSPIIVNHSVDQLVHHPSLGDTSWKHFVNTQQDRAFDLWAYFIDTSSNLLAILGILAVTYAAYASMKYRWLIFALIIGTVPLVLIEHMVAAPRAWTFILWILHIGSAIGLFYLLKAVRDKLIPGFSKPGRTLLASLVVLVVFGWGCVRGKRDKLERFPEARLAAEWFTGKVRPQDRLCVQVPWDAPLLLQMDIAGIDTRPLLSGPASAGGRTFVVVGPGDGQTPGGVLLNTELKQVDPSELYKVQDWTHLEIWSDRR